MLIYLDRSNRALLSGLYREQCYKNLEIRYDGHLSLILYLIF